MLINRGADVKSAGIPPLANAHRANCETCLETLLERADRGTLTIAAVTLSPPLGDASAVKKLLDRGADANATDPKGNTLLMLAASSNAQLVETVKSLIERGVDLNAKNPEGRTALDYAKLSGLTPVVELLVKSGAKEGSFSTYPVPSPKPAVSPRTALERSIPLLQATASTFMHKASCVSCHHNTLTAMTVAIARKNGFYVNEQIARSQWWH